MEHDNVEQVIDENRRRGRPRIRRTSEEEREFRERQRVLWWCNSPTLPLPLFYRRNMLK